MDNTIVVVLVVLAILCCSSSSGAAVFFNQNQQSSLQSTIQPYLPPSIIPGLFDSTPPKQLIVAPGSGNVNKVPLMKPPAKNWTVSVDNSKEVFVKTPNPHFSDGFCSAIPTKDGSKWQLYLSEAHSFRQIADSPFFHLAKGSYLELMGSSPCTRLGKWPRSENNSPFSAGAWLMTVIRCPSDPNTLMGLLHQESRRCDINPGQGGLGVTKSIGWTSSSDEGITWERPQQLLWTSTDTQGGTFKGVGDFCCLWDHMKNHYKLYFHSNNKCGLAISEDSMGKPGTWKIWTKSGWKNPNNGTGGDLGHDNLPNFPTGGNPSCYINTELGLFMSIICTWQNKLMISSSEDGITWQSKPFPQEPHPRRQGGPWPYPLFISEVGGSNYLTDSFMVYYSKTTGNERGMYGKMVKVVRS
jgi:hypothetical protein